MNPIDDTTESFMNPIDYDAKDSAFMNPVDQSGRAKDPAPFEEEHYEGFWRPTYSTWNDYAPSAPAPLKSQKNVVRGPTPEEVEAQIQLERQRERERVEQERLKQKKFQDDIARMRQQEFRQKLAMDMERIAREQKEQERARAEKQRLEMERLERIAKKRREEQRRIREEEERAELERQLLFEPSPGFTAAEQEDLDNYEETTNVNDPSIFPSGPLPHHLLNEHPLHSDRIEMDLEPLPSNASDVFDQFIDNSMFVDTPAEETQREEVKEEEYVMTSDDDTPLTPEVDENERSSGMDGIFEPEEMDYDNLSSHLPLKLTANENGMDNVIDIVPATKPLVPITTSFEHPHDTVEEDTPSPAISSSPQPDVLSDEMISKSLDRDRLDLVKKMSTSKEPVNSGEDSHMKMRKIHKKMNKRDEKRRREELRKRLDELSPPPPSNGDDPHTSLTNKSQKESDLLEREFEKEYAELESKGAISALNNIRFPPPTIDNPATDNRFGHLLLDKRFQNASMAAYNKLCSQAMRSSHPGLSYFLVELGSESSIVTRGFKALENLLNHKVFSSLLDVYSFLHVAYAMSQTETSTPCHSTPAEFKSGLHVLRNCLDDQPKYVYDSSRHVYTETEVFDQIVEIMWSEIDQAMNWLGKQEGLDFMDTLKRTAHKLQKTRNLLRRAQISQGIDIVITDDDDGGEIVAVTAGENKKKRSTWQDVVTGSIFGMVVGFMRAASDTWTDYMGPLSKTAYSFLLHPLEDASVGLQDYIATFFDNAFHTEDGINKSFPSSIFSGALDLLREGTISTLRGFENYMLSLGQIASDNRSDFLNYTEAILRQCCSCASLVSEENKPKLQPKSAPEYSVYYAIDRFISADQGYYPPPTSPKMDNTSRRSSNATIATTASATESDSTGSGSEMVWTPVTQTKEETPATLTPPSRKQSSTPDATTTDIDIVCRQSGCGKTFTTRPNLYRHQRVAHPEAAGQGTEYACGYKGCKAVLRRKDNVHKHRRKVHGIMEKQKVYRA